MKYTLAFWILLSTVISFSACGGQAVVKPSAKKEIPSWYLNPTVNDKRYLYAVGMGVDKHAATVVALNEVSSYFGVVVESSFNAQESMDSTISSDLEKKISSDLKAKVSATKITNYEVTQVHKQDYEEYIVQIRVDKHKYAANLLEDIDERIKRNQKVIAAMQNRNYLQKFQSYTKMYAENEEIFRKLAIVKNLRTDFIAKSYDTYLHDIEKNYLYYKNNLRVYVQYDSESMIFKNYFSSYLEKNNFQVVQTKSKSTLEVKLSTKSIALKTQSFDLIVYTVSINSYAQKELFASKTMIIKEVKKQSRVLTDKNAAISFSEEINNIKIDEALGIQ